MRTDFSQYFIKSVLKDRKCSYDTGFLVTHRETGQHNCHTSRTLECEVSPHLLGNMALGTPVTLPKPLIPSLSKVTPVD